LSTLKIKKYSSRLLGCDPEDQDMNLDRRENHKSRIEKDHNIKID